MTTNAVKVKVGAQWSFADHAGDFSAGPATAANSLESSPTDVQMTLENLSAAAARQAVKVDLGAVRADLYACAAAIEFFSSPASGGTVDFYWAPSPSGTAGTGNAGGTTGTDAAYTGGGGTVAEGVANLQFIGSLVVGNWTGVQIGFVGYFCPAERYGNLVVVNNTSAALAATDGQETHAVIREVIPDIQAAA